MPGRIFAGRPSDSGLGPQSMRARLLRLLTRPTPPSLALGIGVGACFIVVETLVVCLLNEVTGTVGRFGTLYLLGILLVSTVWGFGLSVTMSVASAIAFATFRNWPAAHFAPFEPQNGLVVAIFLVVALLANTLAGLARVGERFFNLSSDLLCISGPEYVIRVNPAFQRTLGYSSKELQSRPYIDLVVPEDRDRVRAVRQELPGGNETVRIENRLMCSDGSQRWIDWSIVPRRGLFYAVGRDVTERRREQDELHQAQRMVEASRDRLSELAELQAALRRVATLVACGTSPSEVFRAVTDEMAGCLHAQNASINRFEGDTVVVLALSHLDPGMKNKPVVGERHTLEGDNIATRVFQTGRAARLDVSELEAAPGSIAARLREMGLRCTVAVPIVVDGRVWGMAAVGSAAPEPPPLDTEARVGDFADLVATAIADAATRDQLSVLAEQQAALRRVATQVARGATPSVVFSAVALELARFEGLYHHSVLFRYESDGAGVLLAVGQGDPRDAAKDEALPQDVLDGLTKKYLGQRFSLEGESVAAKVLRTGRAARMDSYENAPGPVAATFRRLGIRTTAGAPIIVDGRVWGAAIVGSSQPDPWPPDTESRVGDFADLVATAIANAETRAQLIASRARIVAAADDGRRRLERDLHDGAQQRLVSLGLQARLAETSVPPELDRLKSQLSDVVSGLIGVSEDLQEISRGIHPAILSKGGLGPALKTLARRSTVAVTLDLAIDRRLPDSVEVGAYFIVAEALTNTAKHSRASQVSVGAQAKDDNLYLSIRDDGIGGADLGKGSGLIGLKDRAEALRGQMRIVSPAGSGTSVEVTIPLDPE
jgi:PAS domain S-box-containing protein